MNKKLLTAAVLAALTLSTTSVFAAIPTPTFSGDAQLLTQKNAQEGSTYTDVRLRLNIDAQLGDGMYAHGRLMGIDQGPSNFGPSGTGSSGATMNMEQMYLGAKVGVIDAKVGRQPLGLGGQGLLADVNGIEGVSLATSVDNVNMSGFVGRSNETNPRDTMAASIGTKFDGINMGAAYMKTNENNVENKYLSLSADGKATDNVTLGGEYIKNDSANAGAGASGFLVKATIGELAKKGDTNYAISYRNIENGAVDSNWVTNGAYADSKGVRLAVNHKVTDTGTLALYQDITKKRSDDSKQNQFRAEYDVNF